jgi:hypothetical protein
MRRLPLASAAAVFVLLSSCTVPVRQRSFTTAPASLNRNAHYLKAHLKNGDLYLLSDWTVDAAEKNVTGTGDHYDANRRVIGHGAVTLPIDSVALFETNVVSKSRRVVALSVMTGVTAAVAVVCAASPKTCFGSCPTFYAMDGDRWSLQAEGFSASVLPALEDTDLDALYRVHPATNKLTLRMMNEALETHVIRSVRLIAAPRAANTRVFATADREFWESSRVEPPVQCHASEGDCRDALREFDGIERFSSADPHDLSRHETIDLQFSPLSDDAPVGVVIAARQTLLSTFLFYQTLAYLGTRATAVLASFERDGGHVSDHAGGIARLLGGIDVLVEQHGRWTKVATFHETGPLATDVQLLPIPRDAAQSGHVRLSLARGLWRLDYVALAQLEKQVEPVVLLPVEVRHDGEVIEAKPESTLTTLPGDVYEFTFKLPDRPDEQELFLESRGYYIEWMRDEWVREESRLRAAMMFFTPHLALRFLAPQFKTIEPQIEWQFWNSRYAKH